MSECEYSYDTDYDSRVYCGLESGHDKGPNPTKHRAVFEWETRPLDICLEQGHKWSRWKSTKQRDEERKKKHPFGMLADPFVIRAATKYRACSRCKREEDNGKHSPIYPVLTPFRNSFSSITPEQLGIAKQSTPDRRKADMFGHDDERK